MRAIDRWAIVVRYREPYLAWALSIDADAAVHAFSLAKDMSVYLVPDDLSDSEDEFPTEDYYVSIFEHELGGWCTDPARWPKKRDLTTFRKWFGVSVESIVTDLGEGRIRHEDM